MPFGVGGASRGFVSFSEVKMGRRELDSFPRYVTPEEGADD